FSVKRSRQTARSRAALQETRDPAHRCAAVQESRDAALARSDAGIRGMGGSDESAAAARALRPRKAAPRGLAGVTGNELVLLKASYRARRRLRRTLSSFPAFLIQSLLILLGHARRQTCGRLR